LCTTPHPYCAPAGTPPLVECQCQDELCRDCGDAHPDPADCPRERHERLDRYVEAVLGTRLHLMALAYGRGEYDGMTPPDLRLYQRWQELYVDFTGRPM
jgi:hypothetical protein